MVYWLRMRFRNEAVMTWDFGHVPSSVLDKLFNPSINKLL